MATTITGILATLSEGSSILVLGLQVGEEIVPLVKGAITDIKSIFDGKGSVTYQVALSSGDASLDDAGTIDQADLALINQELVRLGQAPVTVPADTPIADDASAAEAPAAPASSPTS